MKEFVSGASVRLAELEDLFVDMKARVKFKKSFHLIAGNFTILKYS